MTLKDNPNCATTKEICEMRNCSRAYVQKLEAMGKLRRAGVEGNRVYYWRQDAEALDDERVYGAAHSAPYADVPSPSSSPAVPSSLDGALRKMERNFLLGAAVPPAAPPTEEMVSVQRRLTQIHNALRDQAKRDIEWRHHARRPPEEMAPPELWSLERPPVTDAEASGSRPGDNGESVPPHAAMSRASRAVAYLVIEFAAFPSRASRGRASTTRPPN